MSTVSKLFFKKRSKFSDDNVSLQQWQIIQKNYCSNDAKSSGDSQRHFSHSISEQTGTYRRSEFSRHDGFYLDQSHSGSTQFGLLWRRTRDSRKPSGQDLPVSRPLPAGRDTGQPRARWHKAAVSTAPPTPPHPRTSTAPRRAMTSGTNAETWSCLPRGVAQTRPVRVPAPQGCSCASAQTGIST